MFDTLPAEYREKAREILEKSMSDQDYRKQLIANPSAVLAAEGIHLPSGLTVNFVENTASTVNFVLPALQDGVEISDEELEGVSGGWGGGSNKYC
ncbi:MAG: NHLP leader peptide family RiPP precursor [Pseudomonadota bacterium]